MATDNELISIADLIVGLRDSATHARNIATERKSTIEQRDAEIASLNKKLADEKQAMQDLISEADALRRGITVYRGAYVKSPGVDPRYVEEWEASVGSVIWPRKLAATVSRLQQPWHDGEVPGGFVSVPGIEWEVERKSCDVPTRSGIISGSPLVRHRPTNIKWEAAYKTAANYLGKAHCLAGFKRMQNAQIGEAMGLCSGKINGDTCTQYHESYSEAVEFLRPAVVSVVAVTRAEIQGMLREYIKPMYEAPESRPFRFVDSLGRPVSWTFLDPKMPASGAEPKAADAEPPPQGGAGRLGAELRQGRRPKVFEKLTGIVWDDQLTPHFASRPVNSTWAEAQRRAAEILGREDCLAGRERLTTEGVYEAVGMTHEDRAKTDAAAVAYQKAYSEAVAVVKPSTEFRPGGIPKGFPSEAVSFWDHGETRDMVRPMDMTWSEAQQSAAEIIGRQDSIFGRERLDAKQLYDMLALTGDDRATSDILAVYQQAYSTAVKPVHISKLTKTAINSASVIMAQATYSPSGLNVIYLDISTKRPISWRILDPDMDALFGQAPSR